jgi:hypothetical protein
VKTTATTAVTEIFTALSRRRAVSNHVTLAALAATLIFAPCAALAADVPGNAGTGAELKVTSVSTAARMGQFQFAGDSDWYKVQLTKGKDYAIAANELTSSFGQLLFQLRSAGGAILVSRDDDPEAGSSGFEFRATKDGKHFLELKQVGDFEEPFSYATRISRDCRGAASTKCRLEIGEAEKGVLTWALDEDWLRARLTVGKSYSFKVDQIQFPDSLALKLYDQDGNLVAEGQPSGETLRIANFAPTETGRHFVSVAGINDEIDASLYRVTLTQP